MSVEVRSLIESSPFLGALSSKDADRLASIASIREFSPGEAIVREGTTEAMTMWIVAEGEVEVRKGDAVVTTMGRGAHIGEMALFAESGHPRSAGVYAKDTVRAFRVAKWDLMPMVERNPEVALAIIKELAQRLERVTNQLA